MLTLPKRAAGDQEGFSLVELLVALTVLLIGILGLFAGFASSQKLSLVSERHATMSHIAEQEIERLEGMSYSTLELSTAPTHSTDPKVPDYYVTNGTPPLLAYDRTGTATESLLVDPAGAVAHMHTQQQGTSAYNVYDFVTATSDPKCAPGCPAGTSYKRVTVAVTVASGLEPTPVWSSSIIADPAAESVSGCGNGNCGNPATYCPDSNGNTVQCSVGLSNDSGPPPSANTFYLHECVVILPCTPPTSDHPTVPTVGAVTALTCSTLSLLGLTSGCPTPTLMDPNPPTSSPPTPLHYYSTDLGTTGTNGGLLLQKTGNALGIPSDCSGGAWTNNLINTQSHMWVTNALTSPMTLTGDGNLSIWTYTNLAATASVSFCVEMYDMPSEGPLHQLVDILIPGYQPVAIGGAAYIPAVNPSTSGNWPTTPTQVTFPFRFLALNTNATSSCTTAVSSSAPACTVPIGDRIGFRIWVKVSQPVLVDFIYDTTSYPAALQLNSQ